MAFSPREPMFGVCSDLDEAAFDCLDIAVQNGYTVAALPLLKLCSDQHSCVYNPQKVIELKSKITNDLTKQCQEDPDVAFEAGYFYLYEIEPQDIQNAKKYFLIGAHEQNASCIWKLGEIAKEEGEMELAFILFLKAARLGQGMAMFAVAEFYENGYGVSIDISKAIYWYNCCVESKYAASYDAQKRLEQLKNK